MSWCNSEQLGDLSKTAALIFAADLYGPTTVKQIIDCNHFKRGPHGYTSSSVCHVSECFFPSRAKIIERLQKVAEDLAKACVKSVKSGVQKAYVEMVETI